MKFLKNDKNAFDFMLKAVFVLKIFIVVSYLFGYVKKRLVKKVKVNFKIYEVTTWAIDNYNTHIAQYLKK